MPLLIAFDLESTGVTVTGPTPVEAIQIGANCLNQDTYAPTRVYFECKMRIEHPERVEPGVLGVYNHYDAALWEKEAVSQVEGWQRFSDWVFTCGGGGIIKPILLGHNISAFDDLLAKSWLRQFGISIAVDRHQIDTTTTYQMFKQLAGIRRYGLGLKDICEVMEFTNPRPHDALMDATSDGMGYALMHHYMAAMIDCGRVDHKLLLDEAYLRIGRPRDPKHTPLPRRAA